jgi:hypothetical protein
MPVRSEAVTVKIASIQRSKRSIFCSATEAISKRRTRCRDDRSLEYTLQRCLVLHVAKLQSKL